MLFELKQIINQAIKCQTASVKCVLASVVDLDGSSYRKPGVRMLITEHGETVGAVSGGCVEKEVVRQAQVVFENDMPSMMTYDGRYRLGCEGVLYILIEPVFLSNEFLAAWFSVLERRVPFELNSKYSREVGHSPNYGTIMSFDGQKFHLRVGFVVKPETSVFLQTISPVLRLVIIGTEHDAVHMAMIGHNSGMEVTVVSSVKDSRQKSDFLGASHVVAVEPDNIQSLRFDYQTAVILMTHSYSRDFQYALAVLKENYCYFGIIGSNKRKDMLFDELLQFDPTLDFEKLGNVSSPAGLDIGAITPQEIAISVISEIVYLVRNKRQNTAEKEDAIKIRK